METKDMTEDTPVAQNVSQNMPTIDRLDFKFDPDEPMEKVRYRLRKSMIASCKKKGFSNKLADELATRNMDHVLSQIMELNFDRQEEIPAEESSNSVVRANAEVIKGTPALVEA
jgi:hypothetical protein